MRPGRSASPMLIGSTSSSFPRQAAPLGEAPRCFRGRRRCSGTRGTGARPESSRGPLPVRPDVAALGDDLAQRKHRRVGGEDDELAAGPRQLEAAIERAPESARPRPPRPGSPRTCSAGRAPPPAPRWRRPARGRRAEARSRRPRSRRRRARRQSRRSARSRRAAGRRRRRGCGRPRSLRRGS